MKIVILGAGASYDCINKYHEEGYKLEETLKWRPPLGNDILGSRENFRDIYDLYPGAELFSHSINASNDIEEFFQKKWSQAIEKNDNVTLANLINTQYCFQHLFYEISKQYSRNIGVNNYQILVQQAYDYTVQSGEEVAFITFNYDLLLERALLKVFDSTDDITLETYTKYSVKIFKPHGSCNWVRRFKNFVEYDLVSNLLKQKTSIDELEENLEKEIHINYFNFESFKDSKYKIKDEFFLAEGSGFNGYKGYFPQLLIPMKEKDEFVMPKEHEAQMVECLKNMTDLLVIGWKGQEAKFLELIANLDYTQEVNLTAVTCEEKSVENELKRVIRNLNTINFNGRFYERRNVSNDENDIIHNHEPGSFSSYILNQTRNKKPGFFNIK